MAIEKLGSKEASQLFATQARAQASTASSVASLLAASLEDPSLGPVAEQVAARVYAAAEKALAKIEGTPLDQTSLEEGRKAVQTIHGALKDLAGTRTAYWTAYREREVPKNAEWLPEGGIGTNLHRTAEDLASRAKEHPVATVVNSQQVMFAKPGDSKDTVLARWEHAREVAEYGSVLGNMRSDLEKHLKKAEGLAAIQAAQSKDPEGRSTAQLISDLKANAREVLRLGASEPVSPTAYIAAGIRTIVHPKESARLIAYAAADVRDHHDTSLLQFVGNVRYALGLGLNRSGTDSMWQAALEQLKTG